MDLEALAVARAEQQIESGAWRIETRDSWLMRGTPRCESCGRPIYANEKSSEATCADCRRATTRACPCGCGREIAPRTSVNGPAPRYATSACGFRFRRRARKARAA